MKLYFEYFMKREALCISCCFHLKTISDLHLNLWLLWNFTSKPTLLYKLYHFKSSPSSSLFLLPRPRENIKDHSLHRCLQSYEIKSLPWTILWFRILGIFSVENIKRLCVFMFQTWDNNQLLRRVLWISAELTIVSSLKHKNTQPLYIFNRLRVLHLDRLKEGTWLHSFGWQCLWVLEDPESEMVREIWEVWMVQEFHKIWKSKRSGKSGRSGMSRISGRSGRSPRSKWSQKSRIPECLGSPGPGWSWWSQRSG